MKRILIVDDATFMRKTIERMLVPNGFDVVGEASNGLEAIAAYERLQPDLVTMDITMPHLSGIDALRKIRKQDPKARVVMITAMGQEHLVQEAIRAGAVGFIVKPFTEEVLMKAVNRL